MSRAGPNPALEVVRNDTADDSSWVVIEAEPPSTWLPWGIIGLVLVPFACWYPVLTLPVAIALGMALFSLYGPKDPVSGWQVTLSRRGITSSWVRCMTRPGLQDGYVARTRTLPWDELLSVERDRGRILLRRSDGVRLALPLMPEPEAAELERCIRSHGAAFEAGAPPAAQAEAERRRVAALLARERQ